MTIRVAINGFGRIGRNILRAIAESGRTDIELIFHLFISRKTANRSST